MSLTSKLRFRKKRSKTLIECMLLAGIFPYQLKYFDIRKYAWTFFSIFSLSYIIIFTSYNLTVLHGFMIKISTIKTVLSAAMCLIVVIITWLKREELMSFIEMTESNFYTYSDEMNFKYQFSVSNLSEKFMIYSSAIYFMGIYGSAVLSHPIYLAFNKNLLKSGSKMLIFTWVPFKGNTITSFYMAHTMLFTVTIPVVMTIVGNVSLTLNFQLEFQNQFERLTYALESVLTRIEMSQIKKQKLRYLPFIDSSSKIEILSSDIFTEGLNNHFEEKLLECVKHYQQIVVAYKKFHSWFGWTYSVILAHSVLTLAMMSYGALLNIRNFGVCIKYLSVLFMYTGQAYIHCSSGEKIFRMNENLANTIYNLRWYSQPPRRRKLLYIFLCEVQRPIKLMGLKIYPASLTIFSSIMKLSYSYLNLLRTYGSSSFRGR